MPDPVPDRPATSRRARIARALGPRLALLALGLFAALLTGELAVRLLSREGPIYTLRDRDIGRRFTRSWEGDCHVDEAGRAVHMQFNREGMRDRDWPAAKPIGEVRVAVLGDSMVAALPTDEERRFTRLGPVGSLRALASADSPDLRIGAGAPEGDVAVQNWGVTGSGPALAVRLFEDRVRAYGPDVVVLVWFVGNDLSDDWQPLGGRRSVAADLDAGGALRWVPYAEESSAVSEWLARNSRLYVWQKRMQGRLGREEVVALRPGLRAFDTSDDPVLGGAWSMAAAVLARFATGVRASGGRPVLLVLPCAEQVYDDLWARTVERARTVGWRLDRGHAGRRLADLARRADLPCVDVGVDLLGRQPRRSVERPADWLFLNGSGHLNDTGHELVRHALRRAIVAPYLDPPGGGDGRGGEAGR